MHGSRSRPWLRRSAGWGRPSRRWWAAMEAMPTSRPPHVPLPPARRRSATCAPPPGTVRRWPRSSPVARSQPRSRGPAAARFRSLRATRSTARKEHERRMKTEATLTVNGTDYPVEIDPHLSLLRAVRDEIGLTGSKEGCDDSECGACMMLLDGKPVNSCSYLAMQAVGKQVTTVEGLSDGDDLAPLQRAFLEHGGVQCGFCTPGMLISATALLAAKPAPSDEEIRLALSGNL